MNLFFHGSTTETLSFCITPNGFSSPMSLVSSAFPPLQNFHNHTFPEISQFLFPPLQASNKMCYLTGLAAPSWIYRKNFHPVSYWCPILMLMNHMVLVRTKMNQTTLMELIDCEKSPSSPRAFIDRLRHRRLNETWTTNTVEEATRIMV
jgi:hypothetical protein